MDSRHLNADGTPRYTNRLTAQASPYLRQHAHNPVDWYPWGDEAFRRARELNRPVHLSVGYAACHWCHVLAAESFEDEATAALLNEQFVNIKVDREERPDVDRIYQIAQQMLTHGPGGWPLTMFLTAERLPFFGGTYFPPEPRHGLPGFKDLLRRVAEYYATHRETLDGQREALEAAFASLDPPAAQADLVLGPAPLEAARAGLERSFDARWGGFGGAPKFPHPSSIERLLRHWRSSVRHEPPDLKALYMAGLTLTRMAEGGIHDALGGGFCRYSVDERWGIPHFEKMLYDNAWLLGVYADAYRASGDELYGAVARDTGEWMRREMQSADGGFYASLDADSDGHEGSYYVWTREEVQATLEADEYTAFAPYYGLDRPPNFEGRWHLCVVRAAGPLAAELGLEGAQLAERLERARAKLLAVRERRVRPARDEKILTAWNGLAIAGLARAARALQCTSLEESASRALSFVQRTLWRDGRLAATDSAGGARLNAYLDDYVFLADGVLELQQLRLRPSELRFACELMDVVLAHFAAGEDGFYFTSDDHEPLLHRLRTFADEALPAGNAVAARVLLRLGYLLGESRYLQAAEGIVRAGWAPLSHHPQSHATLLNALEELLDPPEIVILRGDPDTLESWQRELSRLYAPRRMVLAASADAEDLPQAIAAKPARGPATAYLCRGSVCGEPIETLGALVEALRG
ncbi:MAG: thioredoxin domain-containing protein [Steroidobacteraceae bacterium]